MTKDVEAKKPGRMVHRMMPYIPPGRQDFTTVPRADGLIGVHLWTLGRKGQGIRCEFVGYFDPDELEQFIADCVRAEGWAIPVDIGTPDSRLRIDGFWTCDDDKEIRCVEHEQDRDEDGNERCQWPPFHVSMRECPPSSSPSPC